MRRRLGWIVLLAWATSGATCSRWPSGPPVLVDLAHVAPGIQRDIRYAGSDNFVGAPVEGYGAPRCWLSPAAAEALARVQQDLQAEGLGLRVYDCYRPQRAVDHFARWAEDLEDQRTKPRHYPNVPKSRLFESGYIARRSGHSRASSVDLTLVRLADGQPVDMGSPWDFFDPVSHPESPDVTPEQRANRQRLHDAMAAREFERYPKEWWHFTLREEPWPDRYLDVPIH